MWRDVPEATSEALWMWVAIVVALAGVTVGGFFGWRFAVGRVMRRFLVGLVGSRERVLASRRTLEAVIRHLADEPDEALVAFAIDSHNEDRRALSEIASRMRVVRDDLDVRRLPARLHDVAAELADTAYLLAEEAGRITNEMSVQEVLERVGDIDLRLVSAQYDIAEIALEAVCEEYGVEEAAVYGGGLYI